MRLPPLLVSYVFSPVRRIFRYHLVSYFGFATLVICSTLRLRLPCRLRRVFPSDHVTVVLFGTALYDYYGFVCNLAALNLLSPVRLVVQSSLLRCHGTVRSSPGKDINFLYPTASFTRMLYVRILDFSAQRHLFQHTSLPEVHTKFGWQICYALPSDSVFATDTLEFRYIFPPNRLWLDFHQLVDAHAGRTLAQGVFEGPPLAPPMENSPWHYAAFFSSNADGET